LVVVVCRGQGEEGGALLLLSLPLATAEVVVEGSAVVCSLSGGEEEKKRRRRGLSWKGRSSWKEAATTHGKRNRERPRALAPFCGEWWAPSPARAHSPAPLSLQAFSCSSLFNRQRPSTCCCSSPPGEGEHVVAQGGGGGRIGLRRRRRHRRSRGRRRHRGRRWSLRERQRRQRRSSRLRPVLASRRGGCRAPQLGSGEVEGVHLEVRGRRKGVEKGIPRKKRFAWRAVQEANLSRAFC